MPAPGRASLQVSPGAIVHSNHIQQGKAMALWNTWIIVPLIALSGVHAGFAASSLLSGTREAWSLNRRAGEKVLLVILGLLLVSLLVLAKAFPLLAILALLTSVLIPFALLDRAAGALVSLSILVGSFVLRAWLITDGQSLFF